MQKILSQLRKAITDFNMIKDGDKIAVGLSGGKDSITLATALKMYQRFSPEKFELKAIIIDLFNGKTDYSTLLEYCKEIGLDVVVVPATDEIADDEEADDFGTRNAWSWGAIVKTEPEDRLLGELWSGCSGCSIGNKWYSF